MTKVEENNHALLWALPFDYAQGPEPVEGDFGLWTLTFGFPPMSRFDQA